MEKVRPWCGQPSDRGRLRNRTEHGHPTNSHHDAVGKKGQAASKRSNDQVDQTINRSQLDHVVVVDRGTTIHKASKDNSKDE